MSEADRWRKNAPVTMAASRDLTNATVEYARGLPVVKSLDMAELRSPQCKGLAPIAKAFT
jgi:hypothetical protein